MSPKNGKPTPKQKGQPAKPVPLPAPDLTLTPKDGRSILLAVNADTLDMYARAIANKNDNVAASMVERGLVVGLTAPVGVKVGHRGERTTSVTWTDGPHAGKTWVAYSADIPLPTLPK